MKRRLFFASAMLCTVLAYAQVPSIQCDYVAPTPISPPFGLTSYSYNGFAHTPKGNINVLVIFVGFNSTTSAEDVTGWAHNQIPTWATGADNTLFNLNTSTIGNYDNLSLFYKEMSLNQFTVTATVFPQQVMINQNTSFTVMAHSVESWLNTNYPHYNWGQFDNRTNFSNWVTDNSTSAPDNQIDYTVFAYRLGYNSGYVGYALVDDVPLNLVTDFGGSSKTYQITQGHTSTSTGNWDKGFTSFFEHEFGHNLYSSPHVNNTQAIVGSHFYTQNGWAMMSSGGRVCHSANAWEKWYLGWTQIEANGVNGDIDDIGDLTTTSGIYTLRDFNTYGDAVRIKIPYVANQFLWLENHAGNTIYDDRDVWGNFTCGGSLPAAPLGLMMFTENVAPSYTTVNVVNPGANGIRALNPGGNFDYTRSSSQVYSTNWCSNVWSFTKGAANPFGCHADHTALRFDYDNSGTITLGTNYNNVAAQEQSDIYQLNGTDILGPIMTNGSFTAGKKIGLSYNPAINHNQVYSTITNKLDPIYINGVSVEVLSYAGNGDVTVQIRYDDFDIEQDTRWCGEFYLSDNTYTTFPNDYSTNVLPYKILTIDKSGTANTHLSTTFTDFIRPTTVTCQSGSYLHLEPHANMTIKNGSTVTMQSGSRLEVHEGATLTIENGCTLIIEDGAMLYIWHDGLVHIKPGGTLIMRNSTASQGIWLDYPTYGVYTAELRVEGTLSFESGADFLYQGTGFYHFIGTPTLNLSTGSDVVWIGAGKGHKMVELDAGVVLSINGHPTSIKTGAMVYANNSRLEILNTSLDVSSIDFIGTSSSPSGNTAIYGDNISTKCDIKLFDADDLATTFDLRNINNPPIVNIEDGKFENCTVGINGYYVDKMIIKTCGIENPTIPASIGISLDHCKNVKMQGSHCGGYATGALLTTVKAFYIDDLSSMEECLKGIYSTDSKVFMRNGSSIDNSVLVAAEMYGSWSTSAGTYTSLLTMGDEGCASITESQGEGVKGINTILAIDAVTHDQNDDNNGLFDHNWFVRKSGNSQKLFDICYTHTSVPQTTIKARRNLWCLAGAGSNSAPGSSNYSFINSTNCVAPGSPSITFDRTPTAACIPSTYACTPCNETLKIGEVEDVDPTVSVSEIVKEAFTPAYANFIIEDNDENRAAFEPISALQTNYNFETGNWTLTTVAGVEVAVNDTIVNLITIAKILQEPNEGEDRKDKDYKPVDIFANYYDELLNVSTTEKPIFEAYPNPADDKFIIESVNNSGELLVQVFNLIGRSIYNNVVSEKISIDVSTLPVGLYIINCTNQDKSRAESQLIVIK